MNGLVGMNYVAWYLPYFPKNIGLVIQRHHLEFALCVITEKKKRRRGEKLFC